MVHSSVFFKCLEQMTYQLLHLVHISGADASFIPAFGPDVQSEMVQISTANDLSTPAFGPNIWSKRVIYSNNLDQHVEANILLTPESPDHFYSRLSCAKVT